VSSHIKNSVKSIIFFGSGKKRGSFEAHKKKVFMVAEAPKVYSPSFLLYYDIVAYFYITYSLNNGSLFLEILWLGLGLNQNPCQLKE